MMTWIAWVFRAIARVLGFVWFRMVRPILPFAVGGLITLAVAIAVLWWVGSLDRAAGLVIPEPTATATTEPTATAVPAQPTASAEAAKPKPTKKAQPQPTAVPVQPTATTEPTATAVPAQPTAVPQPTPLVGEEGPCKGGSSNTHFLETKEGKGYSGWMEYDIVLGEGEVALIWGSQVPGYGSGRSFLTISGPWAGKVGVFNGAVREGKVLTDLAQVQRFWADVIDCDLQRSIPAQEQKRGLYELHKLNW